MSLLRNFSLSVFCLLHVHRVRAKRSSGPVSPGFIWYSFIYSGF